MTFARSKAPLLACAVLLASPLFGCAARPPMVQAPVTSLLPPVDGWTRWAAYQQILDQRLLAQQLTQQADPPRAQQQQADRVASDLPVLEKQVFDQRILAAHNRERSGLGLVPLSWNPALAQSAKRWADHLASTGRFEHAPENRVTPEGENLWAGTKGYFSPEAMVNAWIREKKYFRPGTFPDNSITGRVEDVGHYTQLVWRATTQVGCAEARSRSEDILVCRYAEAGNYRGEVPF